MKEIKHDLLLTGTLLCILEVLPTEFVTSLSPDCG
jgi:hypothetical protein